MDKDKLITEQEEQLAQQEILITELCNQLLLSQGKHQALKEVIEDVLARFVVRVGEQTDIQATEAANG